ncbi:MAG: tyrosine--tRNA ligase [Clostridia bacterium]|nr:tyrosine--tRNA ligase [Clostridia bacterium]
MKNVFDVLKERGYIAQCSNEDEVRKALGEGPVTMYCGYDPTGDSLHIGHFLTLMAAHHLQEAGHKIITLVGGGTASIGDPTGKNDMRKMLSREELSHNAESLKKQISKFLDYTDDKAIMVDNADWLFKLEFLPFLRDIAVNFSVNKMLTAECYKSRLEQGLSLQEFLYMPLQSYDFLELNRKYGCTLEFGGDDQWANMIGGIELIRRKERKDVNVMTFTLLTTHDGKKMGKTEKGALFLDPAKTSPYDFYQYFRNIDDADVKRCLCLLTFLPLDEIEKLTNVEGSEINKAKEVLAYEVTKIIHGEDEAKKVQEAARAVFAGQGSNENMPTKELEEKLIDGTFNVLDLLVATSIAPSKSEARRLVDGGGVSVNSEKVTDNKLVITKEMFKDGETIVQKGKKTFVKVKLI